MAISNNIDLPERLLPKAGEGGREGLVLIESRPRRPLDCGESGGLTGLCNGQKLSSWVDRPTHAVKSSLDLIDLCVSFYPRTKTTCSSPETHPKWPHQTARITLAMEVRVSGGGGRHWENNVAHLHAITGIHLGSILLYTSNSL